MVDVVFEERFSTVNHAAFPVLTLLHADQHETTLAIDIISTLALR